MVWAHSFKDFASKTPVYEQYVWPQSHTNMCIRYVLGYVCMNTVVQICDCMHAQVCLPGDPGHR